MAREMAEIACGGTGGRFFGSTSMNAAIADLDRRMAAAAEALDFEEARRLRDALNLIRSGASAEDALQADASALTRQQPGAMGTGTSQTADHPAGLGETAQALPADRGPTAQEMRWN